MIDFEKVRLVRAPDHPSAVHAIRSPYFERFFLPAIGPGGVALMRFGDELLSFSGGRDQVMTALELAESVGLGGPVLVRTVERLARMLHLRVDREGAEVAFFIPERLVTAGPNIVRKWTPTIQALHDLAAQPPRRA